MPSWLKFGATLVAVALVVSTFVTWRDFRRQQATLQSELKTTQRALADATARQTSRDAAVNAFITQLQRQKDKVQTTAQVIAALPQVLPLPQPITLDSPKAPSSFLGAPPLVSKGRSSPADASAPPADTTAANPNTSDNPKLVLPPGDLKPLYDFALDCKACQAQLAAAQADLKDEQAKGQALSRERDDALRAARGGSVLRRVARAAKWFAIGAAAGAIAAKTTR